MAGGRFGLRGVGLFWVILDYFGLFWVILGEKTVVQVTMRLSVVLSTDVRGWRHECGEFFSPYRRGCA